MRTKRRFEILLALLAILFGMPVVLVAQSVGQNMLQPLADVPDPICGKNATMASGSPDHCGVVADIVDFLAGGGSTTTVNIANFSRNRVVVNGVYLSPAGTAGADNAVVFINDTLGSAHEYVAFTMSGNTSLSWTMFYSEQWTGEGFNFTPEPTQLQTGTVVMSFFAPDGLTLDSLMVFASIHSAASNSVATLDFLREVDAMPSATLTLTAADSFAVDNISGNPQAVSISLIRDGATVASLTTPADLPPNGLYESTLAAAFPGVVSGNESGLWQVEVQGLSAEPILASALNFIPVRMIRPHGPLRPIGPPKEPR